MHALMLNIPHLWTEADPDGRLEWVARIAPFLHPSSSRSTKASYHGRSASAPWATSPGTYSEERLLSLRRAFRENLPRARHADIHFNDHYDLAPEVDDVLCGTSFPHLRSLTHVVDNRDDDDQELCLHDSCEFLTGASSVTHLVLGGLEIYVGDLAFPSLVQLELKQFAVIESPASVTRLVSRSPILRDLHSSGSWSQIRLRATGSPHPARPSPSFAFVIRGQVSIELSCIPACSSHPDDAAGRRTHSEEYASLVRHFTIRTDRLRSDPNVSEEAKEHAREVLEERGAI
jgi:hypothetical protein